MSVNPQMPPITRFAAFKFKSSTTDAQKQTVVDGLSKRYAENSALVNYGPKGGKPVNGEFYHKGYDYGFVAQFKSKEAKDEFDQSADHDKMKEFIKPLIDELFTYDFEEGQYGFGDEA